MSIADTWLLNLLGKQVPEQQLAWTTHPRLELGTHYTLRLMQAGAIAGVTIVGPFAAVYAAKDKLTIATVSKMAHRCGALGILFGLAVGPVVFYAGTRKTPQEVMNYRCYVLRHDVTQLRRDRTSLAGAALGYSAARYLRRKQMVIPLVVCGFCCGMLSADGYSTLVQEDSIL